MFKDDFYIIASCPRCNKENKIPSKKEISEGELTIVDCPFCKRRFGYTFKGSEKIYNFKDFYIWMGLILLTVFIFLLIFLGG